MPPNEQTRYGVLPFKSIISDGNQAPRKYAYKNEVYNKGDKDESGRPTRRRLWICCHRYNAKEKEWWYRVKDGPPPDGKDVYWLPERALAPMTADAVVVR